MKILFLLFLSFNLYAQVRVVKNATIGKDIIATKPEVYTSDFIFCDIGNTSLTEKLRIDKNGKIIFEPLPIIILIGQSNQQGGDTTQAGTPFTGMVPGTYIFYKPSKTKPIQLVQYGVNNNYINPKRFYGPECALAYYCSPVRIGIIKYGYPGSKLVDTKYRAEGNWQIDANPAHGMKQYDTMMLNHVLPGLDSFRAKGYNPYIIAVDWCQGEGDSQDPVAASRYAVELIRLFDKFKVDTNNDSITFIITKTHPLPSTFKFCEIVRAAQDSVAAAYPAYLINGDAWQTISDSIHWTRQSQGLHGKAIADIVLPLIK